MTLRTVLVISIAGLGLLAGCANRYPDECYRTRVWVQTDTDLMYDFEKFPCKRDRFRHHWENKS